MNKNIKAVIYMIIAIFIWGVSFLSIKTVVQVVPPMTQGAIRFSISAVCLYIFSRKKVELFKIDKEDIKYFVLAGLVGITLYFYFENSSMIYLDASIASLLIATIPIFTLLGEFLIYKIKLTNTKIISVLISILGVYLIIGNINFKDSKNVELGLLLMLGSVLAWVAYSFLTTKLYSKYKPVTINFYQTIVGVIGFVPFAMFEKVDVSKVTVNIIFHLLFLGVFCSAIAFLLYTIALGELGASRSSVFLNIMPAITVVSSYLILGERINILQILGGVIVIAAVVLCEKKPKKEEI